MRLLFLGTSSGAGKTTLDAAFCRYLKKRDMDPVPFKASNLSLNSYATRDGGEIGMGQAFQAWSCGLEPETDMNPVLMKPSGKGVQQLIVNGKPFMDIDADHPMDRQKVMAEVHRAYDRLASKHGFVVCEGSGSPAEINLMDRDLANTGLMREIGVPAVLVGDIERGGVFAAIYGTWRIIPDDLKPLMKGFIINRFRGEASILQSGIERIEELTGMKCLGVVPYVDLKFPEEDSLSESGGKLEGDDPHTAFMDNIDELLRTCEEAGLDFDSMVRFASST